MISAARLKKLRSSARWVIVIVNGRNNTLECLRCGEWHPIPLLPIPVERLLILTGGFTDMHLFCEPKKEDSHV